MQKRKKIDTQNFELREKCLGKSGIKHLKNTKLKM